MALLSCFDVGCRRYTWEYLGKSRASFSSKQGAQSPSVNPHGEEHEWQNLGEDRPWSHAMGNECPSQRVASVPSLQHHRMRELAYSPS